jgi:hypothetical protein
VFHSFIYTLFSLTEQREDILKRQEQERVQLKNFQKKVSQSFLRNYKFLFLESSSRLTPHLY